MPNPYPESVIEIIDDNMKFRRATLCAVREFAQANPWQGTVEERKQKFLRLNEQLAASYDIPEPELVIGRIDGSHSGCSHYQPGNHRIVLTGKLSVVTYLHEFAHAMGKGERGACRWSVNLFRKCFPRQYSRLVHRGHTLVRPAQIAKVEPWIPAS